MNETIVPGQPMTVPEVADYLRISRAIVLRLLGSGEIRAKKVGKAWRVQKEAVDEYLARPDKKVRK